MGRDTGKKGKHVKGKKEKDKDKEKHKGKRDSSPKFEATVVIAESGDTSIEIVATRTAAEVDEDATVDPPNSSSNARSRTNGGPPPLLGLSAAGNPQMTAGTISTLVEDHACSGWLCAHATDANDTRLRENEFVEPLVNTGATVHVCGPHEFKHVELVERATTRARDRHRCTGEN